MEDYVKNYENSKKKAEEKPKKFIIYGRNTVTQ